MPIIATPAIVFSLCALVCILLCAAVWRWRDNRNSERISPDFKLLRGPGESLQRRIAATDENLFIALLNILGLPFVVLTSVAGAYIFSTKPEFDDFTTATVHFLMPVLLVWTILWAIRILRLLSRRRNFYLGYFGERVVSENLDPIRAKGGYIFHDVPLEGRAGTVNIDHVVVCPAGIFAIETKTRRKRRVLEGRVDGKVIYDGAQLTFPWGADTFGLSQAMTNALWLDKNIDKAGLPGLAVQPILTFPGWRVEQTATAAKSTVCVLNPAQIPHHLDTLSPALSANQIKHVAQQLETLCRDVEF